MSEDKDNKQPERSDDKETDLTLDTGHLDDLEEEADKASADEYPDNPSEEDDLGLDMSFLDDLKEMGEEIPSADSILLEEKDEEIAALKAELAKKDKEISTLTSENNRLDELSQSAKRQHQRLQERFNTESRKSLQDFVTESIIPTVDSLENALNYISGEQDLDGIKGILSNFYNSLAKAGIEKVDALDTTFDPEYHNALATVPVSDKDNGIVVEVQQNGYKDTKTGRLLRPANVIVCKK